MPRIEICTVYTCLPYIDAFSPVWQSCNDSCNIVLDGVVEGLEDSDGCYSSFDDEWNDCNDDDCDDNFGIDSDDGADDGDEDVPASAAMLHVSRHAKYKLYEHFVRIVETLSHHIFLISV